MSPITGPSSTRPSASRLGRFLLGGAAAGALVFGAGVSTAAATADGCTYTSFPHEYVCGTVHGEKLHVDKVTVVRGKMAGGVIDDYHAEVNVYTPKGKHLVYKSSLRTGKRYVRATVTVHIDRSFPDGSKICGALFERGSWEDSVCWKIHD